MFISMYTSSQMFGGLAAAQRAEACLVLANVAADGVWLCLGVFAQRPANGLADEEVFVGQVRSDAGVEEVFIGRNLEGVLAENRGAALPEVGVAAPGQHRR